MPYTLERSDSDMRWSTAAGVGVVVVLAVAILVFAYVLLESAGVVGNTYPLEVEFENAQGITEGAEVRMAGVKIGEVEEVRLTPGNRALLILRIRQKYDVPEDAEIRLGSSGLFSPPVVEIVPRRQSPTTARQGTSPPTLDQLLPEAQRLMVSLRDLAQSTQQIVGDPQLRRDLKRATTNIAEVSEQSKQVVRNVEAASESGRVIAAQFRVTAGRLDRTVALVQQTVGENRGKLGETLTSVNDTLVVLQGLIEEFTTIVADPQVRGSLRGTLNNVEQASANLVELSSHLSQLTGDPQLSEDLRATVKGSRATVEETQRLFERLNRILGSGRRQVEGARQQVQNTDVTVDLAQETSPGKPRLDLNAFVPAGPDRFYQLGLYDLSESTRLNLQLGQSLGRNWIRYGLHASRLGIGLDIGPPSHPRFSADLYGLEDPQLDLRARTGLGRGLDLTFGVQSVFTRASPTIGVTWRK
jgi:phospholipid/cholesterol/gamma-HCH transport system substrate-binding protein